MGRTAELRHVDRALASAADGRVACILLHGEAGSGKTSLLEEARHRADRAGFTILATVGRSADAELGFSSLLTLLRPVEGDLDALAGECAQEVRAALALGRRTADAVAVQLGVFRLLSRLAERAPLLVAVDDADQLDAASADVLAFALRRLDADAVAGVLTVKPDAVTVFDDVVANAVTLGPMDEAELCALVRADGGVAAGVARQCAELAGGNPLAAIELCRSLRPAQREGLEALPLVPQPSGAVARGFAAALEAASDAARRALVVAAADDTDDVRVVAAALEQLGEPRDGLIEAEAAGLLEIRGTSLRLAHPLLRPVAYHQVAPASRRAAHRALAAVLDRPDQGPARAWQRAAAADGPDEEAASALELAAGDALRRGGPGSAARILERSAELSPDPAARGRRLTAAAWAWIDASDLDAAARSVAHLDAIPADIDAAVVISTLVRLTDGVPAAIGVLRRALQTVEPDDRPAVEALLADELLRAGDADGAAELAARPASTGGVVGDLAAAVLAGAGAGPAADLTVARSPDPGPLQARARARTLRSLAEGGHVETVLSALGRQALADRWAPGESDTAIALADALVAQGHPVRAAAHLQRVLATLPARAQRSRVPAEVALAGIEVLLGQPDDARARIDAAAPALATAGLEETAARAAWVQGRAALADGDPTAAVVPLEHAARVRAHLYVADLTTALAASGDAREVAAWAARVRHLVGHPDVIVDVRARRAVGAAGRPGELSAAVTRAQAAGLTLEAAESALAAAEDAARRGAVDAVRGFHRDAEAWLTQTGARGWAGRLGTVGEGGSGPTEVLEALTKAERRVALSVADGRTNQEAADALFISAKTVDFHLRNIYRKLSLRSRTELAVLVNRGVGPGVAP